MNESDNDQQFQEERDELVLYKYQTALAHEPNVKTVETSKQVRNDKLKVTLVKPQKQTNNKELYTAAKKCLNFNYGRTLKVSNAIFRSNFQCGNIETVTLTGASTYRITLEREINSNRTSAWFYFTVEGLKGEVAFIISGFTKSSSLYSKGMKICYKQNQKWRRGGSKITYSQTTNAETEAKQYQLKFNYYFKSDQNASISFAYCFPYTYQCLYSMIKQVSSHVEYSSLGKTYEGRAIPMLSLGNPDSNVSLVFSGRVHPGESVSSFVIQGLIKELVSDTPWARSLRETFYIRIVPMINPDGVCRGNYRFSAAGYDLNRKWKNPKKESMPQIYLLKQMILELNKERTVKMYIDFHGHSRKKNIFFYGCSHQQEQEIETSKMLPFLMSKLHEAYRFQYCSFSMSKEKQGTARVCMYNQLDTNLIYTLQSSFCGQQSVMNFLTEDYLKTGQKLVQGIALYFKDSYKQTFQPLDKLDHVQKIYKKQLKDNKKLLKECDNDGGSDSQPEKGCIPDEMKQTLTNKSETKTEPGSLANSIRIVRKRKVSQKMSDQRIFNLGGQIKQKEMELCKKSSGNLYLKPPSNPIQDPTRTLSHFNFDQTALFTKALYIKNLNEQSKETKKSKSQAITSTKSIITNKIQTLNASKNESLMINNKSSLKTNGNVQTFRRNFYHQRETIQFRRIRKLAEPGERKLLISTPKREDQIMPSPIVHKLVTPNSPMTEKPKKKMAPFYPHSQHSCRRLSFQISLDRFKRLNPQKIKPKQPDVMTGKRVSANSFQEAVKCRGVKLAQ